VVYVCGLRVYGCNGEIVVGQRQAKAGRAMLEMEGSSWTRRGGLLSKQSRKVRVWLREWWEGTVWRLSGGGVNEGRGGEGGGGEVMVVVREESRRKDYKTTAWDDRMLGAWW